VFCPPDAGLNSASLAGGEVLVASTGPCDLSTRSDFVCDARSVAFTASLALRAWSAIPAFSRRTF